MLTYQLTQMTEYEFKCIHGIPFLYSNDGRVFHYDTTHEPVHIGHYTNETNVLQFRDGWRELLQSNLDAWRAEFAPHERGTFKKPETIRRSKKPRVSQRNPRKPTKAKGPASLQE